MGNENFKTSIKQRTKNISISKFIIWAALVSSTAITGSGYFLDRGLGKAYSI